MHDYAIINHNRANIGRWLGVISLSFSFIISSGLLKISAVSQFNILASFTVSSGILYVILYFLFNKVLWRIIWLNLPNIQGVWSVNGCTLDQDNNVIHKWSGSLDIDQTWDKIAIILKTNESRSESYTATLRKESGRKGGWILYYSYKNESNMDKQSFLSAHKGFCEIIINEDNKSAKGSYFNNYGRYTFGQITLKKEI